MLDSSESSCVVLDGENLSCGAESRTVLSCFLDHCPRLKIRLTGASFAASIDKSIEGLFIFFVEFVCPSAMFITDSSKEEFHAYIGLLNLGFFALVVFYHLLKSN
jgi:hypothetical protein